MLLLLLVGCFRAGPPIPFESDDKGVDPCEGTKANFIKTSHSTYPISAWMPSGWVATEGDVEEVPCQSWVLHPQGADWINDPLASRVVIWLDWLPRKSRHSAGYPGDRAEDQRDLPVCVGGEVVGGTMEAEDTILRANYVAGELVASISGLGKDTKAQETVGQIVRLLEFDKAAKPPNWPGPERQAMDLALDWAAKEGFKNPHLSHIVSSQEPAKWLMMVSNHDRYSQVWVDPVTQTVEVIP
ncbi:MAG: hypothetical protein HN348_21020 [Proteobacteria bacterium]|nr:hypothetical protein [Pseudomonadota bacterium]